MADEFGIYVVAFDRPGYGESDPDPNRSLKSTAQDIEELADQLELGPKFFVMGFSMGGAYVWTCLKYIPHRYGFDNILISWEINSRLCHDPLRIRIHH